MYNDIVEAIFIKRINRFIAEVEINGVLEFVHVKNTGRCKELFIQGRTCYLERATNPNRKTKYSLISIYKDNLLINIDSQIPNRVVFEGLKNNLILENLKPSNISREKQYKNSRFDIKFYSELEEREYFLEVKGVTLENNGVAMFPDAPTTRGSKHILELIDAKKNGYGAIIFFLIQFEGACKFIPNSITDIDFSNNLKLALNNDVSIFAYDSTITSNTININNNIPLEI